MFGLLLGLDFLFAACFGQMPKLQIFTIYGVAVLQPKLPALDMLSLLALHYPSS